MTLRKVLSGVTAVWLLAGCGGGSGSDATAGSPSGSPASNVQQTLLQLAQCYRANGQPNFPDPVQDAEGRWGFPEPRGRPEPPAACKSLSRQVKQGNPRTVPKPPTAAEMAKLRDFAKCMRQHGVPDWPDPNDNGHFTLPTRLAPPNGDQLTREPLTACPSADPIIDNSPPPK